MSTDFYAVLRAQRETEAECLRLLGSEVASIANACQSAEKRIEEINRRAAAEVAQVRADVEVATSRLADLQRQAADFRVRVESMDLLLLEAPEPPPALLLPQKPEPEPEPEPEPDALSLLDPRPIPLTLWLDAFLRRHPTSDFTVSQLTMAAQKANVEKTRSPLNARIRTALEQRLRTGQVIRRDTNRGQAYKICMGGPWSRQGETP